MSKTVGFYGGKFYPIHLGHVYAMTVASTIVDELHVIVSYDDNYEKYALSDGLIDGSKLPHVNYKQRLRWWSEITKDMPHVFVHAVYETNDGLFESWEQGAEGIRKAIGKPITHVFSSESAYGEYFDKLYPEAEHVIIDEERSKYPVSATKLRTEGVFNNWELLPEVVRRHYVKKIMVVGTESCGKTTLMKNLATIYNTNYVEEHGRTFYEELGTCEDITMPEDYPLIAYRQKYFENEGLKNANKLVFMDTEAIVTLYYLRSYLGRANIQEHVLREIAELQKYDLWLFLEPDVDWVDDGTRTFGEQKKRESNNKQLKFLLASYGVEYIEIRGNYHARLKTAIEHIDSLINEN